MEKEKKEVVGSTLTTEKIKLRFKNQFDLVTYAIRLAENMIKTGRDPRVETNSKNRAMQILAEIDSGKDHFDEIVPELKANVFVSNKEVFSKEHSFHEPLEQSHGKGSEKRKARKLFTE